MKKLLFILFFIPTLVFAKPFVVSDKYSIALDPKPTHCGIFLDSGAEIDIPITVDTSGTYCKYDIGAVSIGSHTIKLTHKIKDLIWGDLSSPQSAALNFTRPGVPVVPTGLIITPN